MREENQRELAVKLALSMYANEPCRICGENITIQDVKTAVYAGYGDDGRSAHGRCWDGFVKIATELLDGGILERCLDMAEGRIGAI